MHLNAIQKGVIKIKIKTKINRKTRDFHQLHRKNKSGAGSCCELT